MTRYSLADWKRLGRAVYSARVAEGFGDTQQWCDIVGRSDRMLLGLERGESVGKGTLRLIEDALGWDAGQAFTILDGATPPTRDAVPASVRDATDEQLIEELRRRLLAGPTERQVTSDGAPMTAGVEVIEHSGEAIEVAGSGERAAPSEVTGPRRVAKRGDDRRHPHGS